jgi:hypothetical protein
MWSFISSRIRSLYKDYLLRLRTAFLIITLFVLIAYLWNNLLPMIDLQAEVWEPPVIMPEIKPVGTDFREGYYYPAKIVLQGKSPYVDYNLIYPPFSAVFSIPFRLFNVDQAYLVQVVLLYLVNAITLGISLKLAWQVLSNRSDQENNTERLIIFGMFALLAFLVFNSYGFLFSVERGNSDIYALFLVVMALWVMVKKPRSVWLPVILISMATHLKLYPAIMFLLIIWSYKWKSLLPLTITNIVLGLVLGPERAWEYLQIIYVYIQKPNLIAANHSAASFAEMVNHYLIGRAGFSIPALIFYLLPLLVWGIGVFSLWKRKYSPVNAVLFFALSTPLMELIPSTSYDYKLVNLIPPLAMILLFLIHQWSHLGKLLEFFEIIGLMFLMLFINRSYTMLPAVLTNKYPFIFLMQTIFLLVILFSPWKENASLGERVDGIANPIIHQAS